MKLLFKKILSLHEDGAVCFLLIFEEVYKVMLDCGINHHFDFSRYREFANELKDVSLVLISHSAIEYSGAYSFLISELGLNPKIFYTTQPIMRYSPLNLHEEILNLRIPNYNKKIFNRIYSEYEEMQLVKPFQKKEVELTRNSQNAMINDKDEPILQPGKKIHFCCYLAGGYLGSVYWRISYGLVNILYLVDFNNYSMQHIGGLDLDNIQSQTINLLITDGYPRRQQGKKEKLYMELKRIVINFYKNNYLDPTKPKTFNPEHDKKLLISCYPNELVVEIIVLLRKIVQELQQGNNIEKIGVVHLSSRYLELVKSQSEYFSLQFKAMLEKLNQYFEQSLGLNNRINICSVHSTRGVLATATNQNVTVYRIGSEDYKEPREKISICNNLKAMKIFDQDEEKLQRSASKLSSSKLIQAQELEENGSVHMETENNVKNEVKEQNEERMISDENINEKKTFKSKYISSISGIPRFILNTKQTDEQITLFGLRHHTEGNTRVEVKTIYDELQKHQNDLIDEEAANKKQSRIEVMNISFNLPPESEQVQLNRGDFIVTNVHKTQYVSSIRIIQLIKPKDIILVNVSPQSRLFNHYQSDIARIFQNLPLERKVAIYDNSVKKNCYLAYRNELMEYKMNYLPEMQMKKVQRVKGTIVKEGNCLHIHLDCLEDKEIMTFRLQKFYSSMRERMKCKFVGSGIEIEGIKLYRVDNQIILEGEYSEQYFKVRKALYEFLQIR